MSYFDGKQFFEDVEVGAEIDCGSRTVTEREIVEFAEQFDPLAMHTDPEAAEDGPYGGLIASGYHTLAMTVGLLVEESRGDRAVIAGLEIDNVTWHRPVRPGDTISPTLTVVDKRASEGNPGTGVVSLEITVENGDGDLVLTYDDYELVKRRDDGATADSE